MNKLLLGAVGDISFKGNLEKIVREKSPDFAFEHVNSSLNQADVLFGNLESVIVPEEFPHKQGMYCTEHIIDSLKYGNFDIFNMANNHILDCGWRGLVHTYQVVKDMGVEPVGAGPDEKEAKKMRIVDKKGMKVGFIAFQEPSNCTYEGGGGRLSHFDISEAIEDIKVKKDLVDILVVSLHADMEFNPSPSLLKVNFCRKMAENGADIILCHHPHVPQGVELWENSLIAYSLGNFAFHISGYMMTGAPHTKRSHILYIEIDEGNITNWYRKFYEIDETEGRSCPLNEKKLIETEEYYHYLDNILKDPVKLKKIWHEASLRYFQKYWKEAQGKEPEMVINENAIKLMLTENQHWFQGVQELVKEEYDKIKYNDFEYVRPPAGS